MFGKDAPGPSALSLVFQLGGDSHHHTRLLNHVQVVARYVNDSPTTNKTQMVHKKERFSIFFLRLDLVGNWT